MSRFREMQMFVRVVESGSVSAAAHDLKIGQPSISKTVAGLEDRLDVCLLVRSTRRLSPTEAGVAFYERALRAITEATEAQAAAKGTGVRVPEEWTLLAMDLWVIYPSGRLTITKARAFVKWFETIAT